jgi:hypothetical protein
MMKVIIIAAVLYCALGQENSFAQNTAKTIQPNTKKLPADTIYYLADSTKTAPNDRIARFITSWKFKQMVISCGCTKADWKGIFLSGVTERGFTINEKRFKSLKLTTLARLIEIASENLTFNFDNKFVVFIIESTNDKEYNVYKVNNRSTEDRFTPTQ